MAEEENTDVTEEQQDLPAQAQDASDASDAAESTEPEAQTEAPEQVDVYDAELPEAIETISKARGGQLDILLDTSMPVEVRLGNVELEVRDLLQVAPGSVITLDKQAGEPMDLYLKGVRFATAELVLAGERLGVRIMEVLPRRKSDQGKQDE